MSTENALKLKCDFIFFCEEFSVRLFNVTLCILSVTFLIMIMKYFDVILAVLSKQELWCKKSCTELPFMWCLNPWQFIFLTILKSGLWTSYQNSDEMCESRRNIVGHQLNSFILITGCSIIKETKQVSILQSQQLRDISFSNDWLFTPSACFWILLSTYWI